MLRFRSSDAPATDNTAGPAFSQAAVSAMGLDRKPVRLAPNGGIVVYSALFSSGMAKQCYVSLLRSWCDRAEFAARVASLPYHSASFGRS